VRLVLGRAARAGNARAALELGMTFDPKFLGELGVMGLRPEIEQARHWYEEASRLGSREAQQFSTNWLRRARNRRSQPSATPWSSDSRKMAGLSALPSGRLLVGAYTRFVILAEIRAVNLTIFRSLSP
jgi:TPR repeat protein